MASPTVRSKAGGLPVELTSFVGRRRELGDLRRALSTSRLVTLTGPGGVGKTRLATHAAAEIASRSPDGVAFVDLAGIHDPLRVTEAVVTALGVQGDAARWSVSALIDYLAGRRLLLVLDNCEHVLDAAAVLAGTLVRVCPDLRILATSRQALGIGGEVVQVVAPLSLPDSDEGPAAAAHSDAVALFIQRASGPGNPLELDERSSALVLALCRRLDGIPLALELAAVRARALGIEALEIELAENSLALGSGDRSAAVRQRTLDDAIDWSYRLLAEDERALWIRLSVFAGGFELDAAGAVCADASVPDAAIPRLVGALVEKSLVAREERGGRPRFRILEVLRQFGAGRLASEGLSATIAIRHVEWIAALSRDVWAGDARQVALFARIRAERANVWAALDLCLREPDQATTGIAIGRDLWAFWQSERPVSEVVRVLETLTDLVPARGPAHATALWVTSFLKAIQHDPKAAGDLASRALAIGRELRDPEVVAWATAAVGDVAWYDDRWADAASAGLDAFNLGRLMDLPMACVVGLYVAASGQFSAGDFEAALRSGEEAVRISEGLGETWVRAYALNMIAIIHVRDDRAEAAAEVALRCLRLRRDLGDGVGMRSTLQVVAEIESRHGAWERAARLIGGADSVWRGVAGVAEAPRDPVFEPARAAVESALGQTRYEAAVAVGEAMSPADVIEFALGTGSNVAPEATRSSRPGARRPTSALVGSGVLSRRELDVARRIAEGASNAETAADLFISERTVESHVTSIFNKLGFTSRVQLARWVALEDAGRP